MEPNQVKKQERRKKSAFENYWHLLVSAYCSPSEEHREKPSTHAPPVLSRKPWPISGGTLPDRQRATELFDYFKSFELEKSNSR
jgi:hypothetical protein